jgi:hypothetical protein
MAATALIPGFITYHLVGSATVLTTGLQKLLPLQIRIGKARSATVTWLEIRRRIVKLKVKEQYCTGVAKR